MRGGPSTRFCLQIMIIFGGNGIVLLSTFLCGKSYNETKYHLFLLSVARRLPASHSHLIITFALSSLHIRFLFVDHSSLSLPTEGSNAALSSVLYSSCRRLFDQSEEVTDSLLSLFYFTPMHAYSELVRSVFRSLVVSYFFELL